MYGVRQLAPLEAPAGWEGVSGRLVGEVLDNAPTDLRPAELLVLIVLAEDARDTSRRSRYSDVASICHRARLAPGTARNALSELVARGLLIPLHQRARIGLHQEYELASLTNARTATKNGVPR